MTIAVQLSLQRRSRTASLTRRRLTAVTDKPSCKHLKTSLSKPLNTSNIMACSAQENGKQHVVPLLSSFANLQTAYVLLKAEIGSNLYLELGQP